MLVSFTYKLVWLLCLVHVTGFLHEKSSGEARVIIPELQNQKTLDKAEPILINGILLDEETRQPIGYAILELVQSKNNVQANDKGRFVLRVSSQYNGGSVRITALGYMPREINMASLLKDNNSQGQVTVYLKPKYEGLREVEVKAKSRMWRTRRAGFNMDRGTKFHHQFSPLDTVVYTSGQEIGNKFHLKKYPSYLQSISFGLAGSGNVKSVVGLNIYSLKDGLPGNNILSKRLIVRIPPHHTGWITVDLSKSDIVLEEDCAITIEWLSDTNSLTPSSLMAFATKPKDQVMYYRSGEKEPWKVLRSTLTNVNSIGMYVTYQN